MTRDEMMQSFDQVKRARLEKLASVAADFVTDYLDALCENQELTSRYRALSEDLNQAHTKRVQDRKSFDKDREEYEVSLQEAVNITRHIARAALPLVKSWLAMAGVLSAADLTEQGFRQFAEAKLLVAELEKILARRRVSDVIDSILEPK